MKQSCKDALKELLQRRLLEERKQRGLSQVAFARLLMLDVRSYLHLSMATSYVQPQPSSDSSLPAVLTQTLYLKKCEKS